MPNFYKIKGVDCADWLGVLNNKAGKLMEAGLTWLMLFVVLAIASCWIGKTQRYSLKWAYTWGRG